MNDQEYALLGRKLLTLTGVDLECYKSQQMRRRLQGYVQGQADSVAAFCTAMERDPAVRAKILDFLTINVSEFFRDPDQFVHLRERILPELLRQNPRLTVWSAGCSHGGEPYSLAILLEEVAPRQEHRILATDLDPRILERAKAGGPYSAVDVRRVPPNLLAKYFLPLPNGYQVRPSLCRRVEFRRHNLLADSFERGFDLIVCRNVIIYFSDEAKRKLMRGFHQALRNRGVLFIGATEPLLDAVELGFERAGGSFYRKTALAKPAAPTRAETLALTRP